MAILFADDFKGYGTNVALLLNGLWGTMGGILIADPDPNATGAVLRFAHQSSNGRRPFVKGSIATAGCAMRLWLPSLPNILTSCVRFLDGGSTVQCNFAITSTGAIEIYFGVPRHGGVLLAATTVPVLVANAYNHIEFKVVCSGAIATGSAEVRVNGISVLAVTGVATGTAFQLGLGTYDDFNGSDDRVDYIKDLVVWDGSGTRNNDFLGTVSVIGFTPNADVAMPWTLTGGATGSAILAVSPPNDAGAYLTAVTPPPAAAVVGLSDLPLNVTSVRAMIPQVRVRKVDGGDGNVQTGLKSGASTALGIDRPITTAFTYYEDVIETDPATTVAWTPAAANAATLQINRTL